MNYDPEEIRKDFPALNQTMQGKPPIYFDNACMTLRPKQVVDAMNKYYFVHPSCHKRAVHKFGEMTTEEYGKAREVVRRFIHAKESQEIIFTKNTTEAINLVANSFSFKSGDVILTTELEHNSNFLPWQVVCKKKGLEHKIFSLSQDLTFDLEKFKEVLVSGVKLVCIFHTSHITGYSLPVDEIIKLSHVYGALVLIDGAQSAPHQDIDVQKIDADFFVFSFHKMLGPAGMGCLYAKKALLENMSPFLMGGEMVDDGDYNSFVLAKIPDRFEAGLQNYAGAMGAAAAIKYLGAIGMKNIQQHMFQLNKFITDEIMDSPKIKLLGPWDPKLRAGIVNFYIEDMDSGELSILLDQTNNIMARSGVHCCHAWYKERQWPPTLRVSLYFYNTMEEAKRFIETLKKIVRFF